LLDGSHDEELELIDGNQLDEEPEGYQLEDDEDQLDCEENRDDPSTTPTPNPMPNTARTVEMG